MKPTGTLAIITAAFLAASGSAVFAQNIQTGPSPNAANSTQAGANIGTKTTTPCGTTGAGGTASGGTAMKVDPSAAGTRPSSAPNPSANGNLSAGQSTTASASGC